MTSPKTSYRLWVCPEPNSLAELTGWLVDMTEAKFCMEKLLVISSTDYDLTVADAISTSAIIRYCRCFASGQRKKLEIDNLHTISSEEVSAHEYMRQVRDWHIAHPVNQQEVNAIHLIVNDDPNSPELVLGMSSYQATRRSLRDDQLHNALSLCNKWIEYLESKMVEEQLRLKPFMQKLSREEILALPINDPEPNANLKARRNQR